MKRARIVIVGGGIVGAAVFQRLARLHGPEVLLIEKSRPGHGATAYSGGIVRAFHLDPLLAERCAEGLRHYRNLTRNTAGEFRIHRTGFLQLIDLPHLDAARHAYAALSHRVTLEWLGAEEAAQRFGLASHDGLAAAVYEPDAGHVDPLLLARLFTGLAERDGGTAMAGVELRGIATRDGAVCGVHTNTGTIDCEQVVLCTGAWTPGLVRRTRTRSPVTLRAKTIQVNLVSRDNLHIEFPAFVDLGNEAYGRPHGERAALIGCPVDTWDIDPDQMTAPTDEARLDALQRAEQRFGWVAGSTPLGGYRRHDAYEPSGRGVIAWSPDVAGVLIAAGFSGSGVKLAPSTARIVATLLQEQRVAQAEALPA